MTQIKRILIPTDGSDYALIAAEYGLDFAKKIDAAVHTVCVFDYNSMISIEYPDASKYVEETCKKALDPVIEMGKTKGLEVGPITATGDPAKAIIGLSEEYDLIIMGTVGRTGFSRAAMGSVAEKVVRLSKCPVLVYKSK